MAHKDMMIKPNIVNTEISKIFPNYFNVANRKPEPHQPNKCKPKHLCS